MSLRNRLLAAAAALAAVTTLTLVVPTAANAAAAARATCYGGAVSFPTLSHQARTTRPLPSSQGQYTTGSPCNDINIRFNVVTAVPIWARICWTSSGLCGQFQQMSRTTTWQVLYYAADNGWTFRIQLQHGSTLSQVYGGQVAF